ncbi:MAG: hypothetical protein ACE5HU_08515, partial [Acidobacteriota bacterium]
ARGLDALRDESAEVRRLSRKPVVLAAALVLLFLDAPVSLVKSHGTVQDERDAYYSTAEITAMRWLGSQPPGIVLCSYGSGHLIPWLSGHKVYVGHWFMTLDLARKNREVSYFFAPQAPARLKREILRKVGARYVFQGPAERRLGSVDDTLPLDLIHEEGPVKIYRVRDVR